MWYRSLVASKSSPMPVPKAVISERTSWLSSARSSRAFSTFRILPRMGRIAWVRGSRPCTAEPPAESPSTMKISDSAGLREEQSRSLPGMPPVSSGDFRRVASRALRAASRAIAAAWPFSTIALASFGWDSNQSVSWSVITLTMKVRAMVLPSLVLVWPSNCGSPSFTEITAVRPSRMSSPVRLASFSFSRPWARP